MSRSSQWGLRAGALLLLILTSSGVAETISVNDADGFRSAVASAGEGDLIELAPGRYAVSVEIPAGVTVDGLDPDQVTIVGTDYAVFSLRGDKCIIRNLTFEGTEQTRRGVTGDHSFAVLRCRFKSLPEAINLMAAPLSDVICCEFIDCGIGVRAIAEASPTVWGCRFTGGRLGVFAMGGAPFVCNNLFQKMETGILLVADSPHQRVFRHNVFVDCTTAGIELKSDSPFPSAAIRNCVFVRCPSAIAGNESLLTGCSDCALNECGDLPIDAVAHRLITDDVGLGILEAGDVTCKVDLTQKGVRWARQPTGTTNPIGLGDGLTCPGVKPNNEAEIPGIRFLSEPYVTNSVSEEYLYLRMRGLQIVMQGLSSVDGQMLDTLTVRLPNGEEGKVQFNLNRFYEEWAMALDP